jgi:ATP-dependent DNA helicase RecG
MSSGEFREAFPAENDYVERKSGVGRAAVQDAVVAFSNADGGVVLIGVDDAGTILGRELSPSALDDIHQAIREARDPGRYSVHEVNVDGRPVIVIAVARRVEGFSLRIHSVLLGTCFTLWRSGSLA